MRLKKKGINDVGGSATTTVISSKPARPWGGAGQARRPVKFRRVGAGQNKPQKAKRKPRQRKNGMGKVVRAPVATTRPIRGMKPKLA